MMGGGEGGLLGPSGCHLGEVLGGFVRWGWLRAAGGGLEELW